MSDPMRDAAKLILADLANDPEHAEDLLTESLNHIVESAAAATLGYRGGKVGGKSTSRAKAKASRNNGKLGGRPKKPVIN